MAKLDVPRGMRDIETDELAAINYLKEKFTDTAVAFNFQIMEPTPIEMLATMEAKSGPSIAKETYSFLDKGERKIALRFDLTIGISRYVTMRRDLKLPVKLASFAGVWRYDEPQAGRYRYFHQWDIEIYGSFDVEADAEVVDFVHQFFKRLGLKIEIRINDRKLIEEFVRTILGVNSDEKIAEIFRAIDKVPKKSDEEILREYSGKLDPSHLHSLLELSKVRGTPEQVSSQMPLVTKLQSWTQLVGLMRSLESRRIENAVIDLGVVRGLDYYSGIVFEVFEPKVSSGALVGGGRYDTLTSAFGRSDMGATGAAGGIERIIQALRSNELMPTFKARLVYVAWSTEDISPRVNEFVSALRNSGIATDYTLSPKSLRKQLEDASARGAILTVILSSEQLAKGRITVRDMLSGQEDHFEESSLVSVVRNKVQARALT